MRLILLTCLLILCLTFEQSSSITIADSPNGYDYWLKIRTESKFDEDASGIGWLRWAGWVLHGSEGDVLKVGDPGILFSANLNIDVSNANTDNYIQYYESKTSTLWSVVWDGNKWAQTEWNYIIDSWEVDIF